MRRLKGNPQAIASSVITQAMAIEAMNQLAWSERVRARMADWRGSTTLWVQSHHRFSRGLVYKKVWKCSKPYATNLFSVTYFPY